MTNAGGMDDAGRGLGTCFSTDGIHCGSGVVMRIVLSGLGWLGASDTCIYNLTGVSS